MNRRLSLLFLLVLVLWPLSAGAQVPSGMSYQGLLIDPMGDHVTGNVFIQVRVYENETPAERAPSDPLAVDEVEDPAAGPGHGTDETAPRAAEGAGRGSELDARGGGSPGVGDWRVVL